MLNAQMHAVRLQNMTNTHQTVYTVLSSAIGKTLATVASALGISQDDAEKKLGALVDESLATRTVAQRDKALYTAA
jgi:predicted ArsR family transcriptional regulator